MANKKDKFIFILLGMMSFLSFAVFVFSVYLFLSSSKQKIVEQIMIGYEDNLELAKIIQKKDEKHLLLNNKELCKILQKSNLIIRCENTSGIKIYFKDEFDVYHLVQESKVKYTKPKKIAILYIATVRYIQFWDDFYKSMEKHFLKRHDKTYFLFTNHDDLDVPKNVVKVHQDQLPWPYITFKRYHFFEKIKEQLKDFDYIYFLNGTMLAIDDINEDIFPTDEQGIMVTIHPGAWNKSKFSYTYDKNPKSKAYVSPYEGEYYVMGGFNGGTSKGFLKLIKTIREWSDIDMKNNVMPLWHDESMLNRYLITYMNEGGKPLILLPEYAIPQVSRWYDLGEFESHKKMLILDKSRRGGHKFLRQE